MQTGMEAFSIDPEELAGALQRRFQSSASVTKLPGKTETGMNAVSAIRFKLSCHVLVVPLRVALSIRCVSTDIQLVAHHSTANCISTDKGGTVGVAD